MAHAALPAFYLHLKVLFADLLCYIMHEMGRETGVKIGLASDGR